MTVSIDGKTQVEDRDLREYARQAGEQTDRIIKLTRRLERLTWVILLLTLVQAAEIIRRWIS